MVHVGIKYNYVTFQISIIIMYVSIYNSTSAGSIPDSYDIYRYLNLVRYSIFDTRYFRRKCNFVDIFRGYLKRLCHVQKIVLLRNIPGKTKSPIFFENPIFSLKNPNFFSKTHEIRGVVLVHILLFENIRNPVFGHFPSFPASSFICLYRENAIAIQKDSGDSNGGKV